MINRFCFGLFALFAMLWSSVALAQDWVVNINDGAFDPSPAGTLVGYTITVDNNDAVTGTPVSQISIVVPTGGTFEGFTSSDFANCSPIGATGGATVTCDMPALAAEGRATMTFNVRSSVGGTMDISATVPDDPPGKENSDNTASEQTTISAGSDLGVSLTSSGTVASGSTVRFEALVTNNGPNDADSYTVILPIPAGVTGMTGPAGCSESGGNLICTVTTSLADGANRNFVFTGQVSALSGTPGSTSEITTTATVENQSPADPIESNDTSTATVEITGGTDVAMSKSRAPSGLLLVGDAVTFELDPTYTGDPPSGVRVVDVVPSQYALADPITDAITAPGWDCSASSGSVVDCTRISDPTAAGDMTSLGVISIAATANEAGTAIENTATVSIASPTDQDPSNDTASDGGVNIQDPVIDLVAQKSQSGLAPGLASVGSTYTFNISALNNGNTAVVTPVILSDDVPAGMTVQSIPPQCTVPGGVPAVGPVTVVCTLPYDSSNPLAVRGRTPTLPIEVLVTASGALTNTLSVSSPASTIDEPETSNNTVSVVTTSEDTGDVADLEIIKRVVSGSPAAAGDPVTFSLEIVNNTPGVTATDVRIEDALTKLINNNTGSGFTLTSNGGADCSNNRTNGTYGYFLDCRFASLPSCSAGSCPVITYEIRPGDEAETSRPNEALIYSRAVPDPNTSNNRDTVTYEVTARTDVQVAKSASSTTIPVGQRVTYVIAARTDAALSSAQNVTITDTLPDNVRFISVSNSHGSCSGVTAGTVTSGGAQLVCQLGTIAPGNNKTVSVVVETTEAVARPFVNTVDVATTTPETNSGNNSADVSVAVADPDFDLLVNKTDTVDPLTIGEDTTYVVTITNNGPSAAEDVRVVDTMPGDRISYQSFTASADGVCSTSASPGDFNAAIQCDFAYIAAGDTREIRIVGRGTEKGSAQNVVQLQSTQIDNNFDRLSSNNQTSERTSVRNRTNIALTKTVDTASVNVRDNFTYTLRLSVLTSNPEQAPDNVVVSDPLPSRMVLTGPPTATVIVGAATENNCTGSSGSSSFSCSFGTLNESTEIEITVPVRMNSAPSYPFDVTNTANASTFSFDVDMSNNTASQTVTINQGRITGTVYRDFDQNTDQDAGDSGVSGVFVRLDGFSDDGERILRRVRTNSSGNYTFGGLPSGTYSVVREAVSEPFQVDGNAEVGSLGGTVTSATRLDGIAVSVAETAPDNDFTIIPDPSIGIAKNLRGSPAVQPDGSFLATFDLVVENFSQEPVTFSVSDTLAGGAPLFGALNTGALAKGDYQINSAPSGSCAGLQSGFDGSGSTVLAQGGTLDKLSTCSISFTIQVRPTDPLPTGTPWYQNQASVDAEGTLSGKNSSDLSDNGTNPDVDGDSLANETGENDPTPVTPAITASIAMIKTADISGLSAAPLKDEEIVYTFQIRNTGNVRLTDVDVTDPLPGITVTGGPITLEPGEVSTAIKGTYKLTQEDINSGSVNNRATVSGTGPNGESPTDQSGSGYGTNEDTVVTLPAGPAVTLIKGGDVSGLSSPPVEGEEVTYNFVVTNTGNVPLINITVTDPGTAITGSIARLEPGESDSTSISGRRAITIPEIQAEEVVNQAIVSAEPLTGGDPVTDRSGTASDNNDATVTPLQKAPSIQLTKTVDQAALLAGVSPNDTVVFGFTVLNTGNVPVTNITLVDLLDGATVIGGPIPSLDPGVPDTTTFTAEYPIKLSDIIAGELTNTATATATHGPNPGDTVSDSDTLIAQVGKIEALPETFPVITTDGGTAGNVLDSDMLNGDPATVDTVVITMETIDAGLTLDPATGELTLAPGQPAGTYEVTYRICSALVPVLCSTTTETVEQGPLPAIEMEKTQAFTISEGRQYPGPGDTITYTLTAKNTGNTPLSSVVMTDTPTDALGNPVALTTGPDFVSADQGSSEGSLAMGETATWSATIVLADVAAYTGRINNAANVAANDPDGTAVGATDDVTAIVGEIVARPETFDGITTDGGVVGNVLDSDTLNGEPATVSTVTITVGSIDDGLTLDPATGQLTLAPGQPAGSYEVTYTICSIELPDQCSMTTETVVQEPRPAIETVKTQELRDNGDGYPGAGDVLIYTIVATNTGNTPLENVRMEDRLTDGNGQALALDFGPQFVSADQGSPEGALAIGETATYSAEFTVTAAVANTGRTDNTAEAIALPVYVLDEFGTPEEIRDVSDDGNDADGNTEDDPTEQIFDVRAGVISALSIVKTTPESVVERGRVVPYTIVLTNSDNAVAGPVDVVDTLPYGTYFVEGSATLDGAAATVEQDGRRVVWPDVEVPAQGSVRLTLSARILTTSGPDTYVNRVYAADPTTGEAVSNVAEAEVRVPPEAVFDCTDIIGKVFNDRNGNGYQDGPDGGVSDQTYEGGKFARPTPQTEDGLPGVRLATVDGTNVRTDEHGRFSLPCAALPGENGGNFILKLDERTLPSGFTMTTENPRVMRVSPGMMTEMNFGATEGRMVRVDLSAAAFTAGGEMVPQLVQGLEALMQRLAADPSIVQLAFYVPADATTAEVRTARALMERVERHMKRRWRRIGRGGLDVSQVIVRAGQ